MTAYFPSQAGYVSQPGMPMSQPYGMPGSYAPTGGVMYVPSHATSHHSRRRRHRHSYPSYGYGYGGYSGPTMVSALPATVATPVVMQPSYHGAYGSAYGHGHGYGYGVAPVNPYSWGNRFRRFLGLPPNADVHYKRDRSTWGFMGYSRRQRFMNSLGGEVTRSGRPVIRV